MYTNSIYAARSNFYGLQESNETLKKKQQLDTSTDQLNKAKELQKILNSSQNNNHEEKDNDGFSNFFYSGTEGQQFQINPDLREKTVDKSNKTLEEESIKFMKDPVSPPSRNIFNDSSYLLKKLLSLLLQLAIYALLLSLAKTNRGSENRRLFADDLGGDFSHRRLSECVFPDPSNATAVAFTSGSTPASICNNGITGEFGCSFDVVRSSCINSITPVFTWNTTAHTGSYRNFSIPGLVSVDNPPFCDDIQVFNTSKQNADQVKKQFQNLACLEYASDFNGVQLEISINAINQMILNSVASNVPTGQPSSQPSGQPTGQPSGQPSGQPTGQPSGQPSGQPTGQPSLPTSQPTGQPSGQPSGQPTGQPSLPTSQPTGQPSGQPSGQPTQEPSTPTSMPSPKPSPAPTLADMSEPSGSTQEPTSAPTAIKADSNEVQNNQPLLSDETTVENGFLSTATFASKVFEFIQDANG